MFSTKSIVMPMRQMGHIRMLATKNNLPYIPEDVLSPFAVLVSRIDDIPNMDDKDIQVYIEQLREQSMNGKSELCKRITDAYTQYRTINRYTDGMIGATVGLAMLMTHSLILPLMGGTFFWSFKNEAYLKTNKKFMKIQNALISSISNKY